MGIDPITLIAQIVNLFLLVWLLKRFLYKPVLSAVEKRQAYILGKVKEAEDAADKADKEYQSYVKKTADFEDERQQLFTDASLEADKQKSEQTKNIIEESRLAREKMSADLIQEKENLTLEIRNTFSTSFADMADKIMRDLSGTASIDSVVSLFQNKLKTLNKDQLNKLKNSVKLQKNIYVYSSDSINKDLANQLSKFLKSKLGIKENQQLIFKKDPELILGIELKVGDINLEWNIRSYFDDFNTNLNNALTGITVSSNKG